METQKKYTYSDWWNGDVIFGNDFFMKAGMEMPIIVNWSDFVESDAEKIRNQQYEIFKLRVSGKLEEVKTIFLNQYNTSKFKERLLSQELMKLENIMFAKIPNSPKIKIFPKGPILDYNDLIDIKIYIDNSIVDGNAESYEFVHSPNSKYQNQDKLPSPIYAQFVWEMHMWLKNFFVDGGGVFAIDGNELESKEANIDEPNNYILSTIEDFLIGFKSNLSDDDYRSLTHALLEYLENGSFPKLSKQIKVTGRLNKKSFGWALNRIFEALSRGVEKPLLIFAKENISLFSNVSFDENDFLNSNLYKYFTIKT